MKPIPSTAEILAFKILNRSVDETWVNWAVDMLMAGFDTEHLVILAGIVPAYNQFELTALTEKVFSELELDYSDTERVLYNYVSYLATECIAGQRSYLDALRRLSDVYQEHDCDIDLRDFMLLCQARDDLEYDEVQWYWDGADRGNIDEIINDYFAKWLIKHPVAF